MLDKGNFEWNKIYLFMKKYIDVLIGYDKTKDNTGKELC